MLCAQQLQAELDARKATRKAVEHSGTGTQGRSLINAFNAITSVQELLLMAGYSQRGSSFRHPSSKSGSFSASVRNGRVHALSTSDPLHSDGDGAHDAFSVFVTLWHQGSRSAALRDAGNNWVQIGGESWNTVVQREFNRRRQEQLLASVDLSGFLAKVRAV